MPIILAENFEQDVPESIIRRYPGSTRLPLTPDHPQAFPLTRGSVLQFSEIPFTDLNARFEVRLGFTNTSITDRVATHFQLFGLRFTADTASTTVAGRPFVMSETAQSLNVIVERVDSRYQIIVLVDGSVVVTPAILDQWQPTSWIGGEAPGDARGLVGWPNFITEIMVAVDTPVGTYLNGTQFHKRELSVTDPGLWAFTDQGYVEDTDKQDPQVGDPRIETEESSSIVFSVDDELEADLTNIYLNKGSILPERGLEIDGVLYPMIDDLTVPQVQQAQGSSVNVQTVGLQAGALTNGDIVFFGERNDVISYADLATAVGLSAGTLMAGTTWLDFLIDGKRILVAKTPARSHISWNHLYAAGLVYGTDGPGPFPGLEGPVNQNKVVEIGGKTYKVRLLRGCDTDPFTSSSGDDPVGTHNSEWTRIFAPIGATVFPSYTGPKFANYTDAQLGVGGSLNGRTAWCQELQNSSRTNRQYRGSTGLSYSNWTAPSPATSHYGWRPCLELGS